MHAVDPNVRAQNVLDRMRLKLANAFLNHSDVRFKNYYKEIQCVQQDMEAHAEIYDDDEEYFVDFKILNALVALEASVDSLLRLYQ